MADDLQQTIESLKALTQNIPEDAEGRRARYRMLQAAGQAVRGMGDRVPQELRDSLYSVLGETEVMLRESELNEERDRNADIEAEARAQLRQRGESGAVVTDRETGALLGVDTGTPIQTPTYAQQPTFAQFEDPRSRTASGRPLSPGGPRAPRLLMAEADQTPDVGVPEALRPGRTAQQLMEESIAISRAYQALREANPSPEVRDRIEAQLEIRRAALEEESAGPFRADRQAAMPTTASGRPLGATSPMASPANFPGPTPTEIDAQQGGGVPQGIAATTAEGVPLSLAPPVDPRGTVDAQTVAGTPRARRGTTSTPVAPSEPGKPGKLDPYDPYNIQEMYDQTGPFTQIRDSFTREGEIKSEAGLQSASDIMAAAEEMKALRSQAFQRMGEDLVAQEQRLRELDLQLSTLREMRFDSDRLFRNRGHGVSLALGMAVGAMQQTISNILYPGANVPNTAMQLVQDAIDRDLREQAVNYQRAQTEIGMGRTAYEMARQMGMDHTAAYEYARAGAQEYVASQLQATRMRMGAGVAAEQMHRAEQDLRLQAMDRKNMALMAMAQAQAPRVAGRGTGTQATTFSPLVAYAPGVTAKMVQEQLGATTVTRIRTSMEGAASVIRITDELRRLVMETGGGQNWATRVGGRIRSLASQLKDAIRQSSGMGALDAGALKMTEDIAGDPVAFTESMQTYLGRLEGLRSEVMAKAQEMARYSGGGLLRFDESLRSQPSPTPPGVEFTDEEQPASGRQGPASTAAQAVADNPIGTAATIIGGTGVLGQATEEGLRDILE